MEKKRDGKFKKGNTAWNKGLPAWNKGLTKETDERVRSMAEQKKGHIAWNKGRTKTGAPYTKPSSKERIRKLRMKVFEYLGGPVCVRCGCRIVAILEINHKNGGGQEELRHIHWVSLLRSILREKRKDEFEVTCRVCNAAHYSEKNAPVKYEIKCIELSASVAQIGRAPAL